MMIFMIIDFNTEKPESLSFDFCVIGAGAAGTYLASKLTAYGRVCLLEAGGEDYSENSQKNYEGKSIGSHHLTHGLDGSRLRFFGGSTNCWAGGCGKFDELDFRKRDWIANSGWPIELKDLNEHYSRVKKFLEIDEEKSVLARFSAPSPFEIRTLGYTEKKLFNELFIKDFSESRDLTLILNFNAVKLISLQNRISKVSGRNYQGDEIGITSKYFVISSGGIASTNFLQRNEGIVNQKSRKNLGIYFQDHPIAPAATLILNKPLNLSVAQDYWGQQIEPFFILPEKIQREKRLLNCAIQIYEEPAQLSKSTVSALKIYKKLKGNNVTTSFEDIKRLVSNPLAVIKDLRNRKNRENLVYTMRFQLEQSPNPMSKLTIEESENNEATYSPILDWNFTQLERHTLDVNLAYFASYILEKRIGILKLDWQLLEHNNSLPFALRGGQHHSGSARMAASEKDGVVDKNLKVFGTDNVYVCSSAVFPTNSWVNPTLTILALADRLATHLAAK